MAEWNTREKNGNWKGGRTIASNGYVLIRVGRDHHLADVRGYAYEHRLVAEQKLGRRLRSGEQVHHRNENKLDNSPSNIEVTISSAVHRVLHRKNGYDLRIPGEPNPEIVCACGCGASFPRYDDSGRPRQFLSGHNLHDDPAERSFIRALMDGPRSIVSISKTTGQTVQAVRTMASKLCKFGKIKRNSRGIYGKRN